MRLADFILHGGLDLGVERPVQSRTHDDLGIKAFETFISNDADNLPGGADSSEGKPVLQGYVGDRLVLLPGRPPAHLPADGVTETARVARVLLQVRGERRRLIGRQHFVGNDRTPTTFDQCGEDLGL